ncbi:MAG: hypothetical protein ACTHLO_02610 [Pseudolabrys sp.]
MIDPQRAVAAHAALLDNPPLPTDGQVVREAMSRLMPIIVSDLAKRWRTCPFRRCRREQCCIAPQRECMAAPRLPLASIETTHEWLAKRLREQLLDILLERVLGTNEADERPGDAGRA